LLAVTHRSAAFRKLPAGNIEMTLPIDNDCSINRRMRTVIFNLRAFRRDLEANVLSAPNASRQYSLFEFCTHRKTNDRQQYDGYANRFSEVFHFR